ncbi:hypothetical protein SAMN05421823_107253 [Catalinimonas alkaloidigena]|uniref:Uncharacterized protein n=2 Tax=Catalinimonas alkaloidigena TaxID=1075417 RepID=A0A1G9M3I2_9BACT|nr:hypothetical protein SAMN05421823_107253 [Catalinimonas alkaloidigena]
MNGHPLNSNPMSKLTRSTNFEDLKADNPSQKEETKKAPQWSEFEAFLKRLQRARTDRKKMRLR